MEYEFWTIMRIAWLRENPDKAMRPLSILFKLPGLCLLASLLNALTFKMDNCNLIRYLVRYVWLIFALPLKLLTA